MDSEANIILFPVRLCSIKKKMVDTKLNGRQSWNKHITRMKSRLGEKVSKKKESKKNIKRRGVQVFFL